MSKVREPITRDSIHVEMKQNLGSNEYNFYFRETLVWRDQAVNSSRTIYQTKLKSAQEGLAKNNFDQALDGYITAMSNKIDLEAVLPAEKNRQAIIDEMHAIITRPTGQTTREVEGAKVSVEDEDIAAIKQWVKSINDPTKQAQSEHTYRVYDPSSYNLPRYFQMNKTLYSLDEVERLQVLQESLSKANQEVQQRNDEKNIRLSTDPEWLEIMNNTAGNRESLLRTSITREAKQAIQTIRDGLGALARNEPGAIPALDQLITAGQAIFPKEHDSYKELESVRSTLEAIQKPGVSATARDSYLYRADQGLQGAQDRLTKSAEPSRNEPTVREKPSLRTRVARFFTGGKGVMVDRSIEETGAVMQKKHDKDAKVQAQRDAQEARVTSKAIDKELLSTPEAQATAISRALAEVQGEKVSGINLAKTAPTVKEQQNLDKKSKTQKFFGEDRRVGPPYDRKKFEEQTQGMDEVQKSGFRKFFSKVRNLFKSSDNQQAIEGLKEASASTEVNATTARTATPTTGQAKSKESSRGLE